jgi:hypothetical protein
MRNITVKIPTSAESVNDSFRSRADKTWALMLKAEELFRPYLKEGRSSVLDLGPDNYLAEILEKATGYYFRSTGHVDLDKDFEMLGSARVDAVTAFEILEHLRNPYMVLKSIEAPILIASVPLNVWFSGPYWNEKDEYDTHYHEFYQKQFRSLLEKTGWNIRHEEFWKWGPLTLKPRPLLRKFGPWPSWMAVICERA